MVAHTLRLDERYRLTLPKGARERLHLGRGDRVEIVFGEDGARIRKVVRPWKPLTGRAGKLYPLVFSASGFEDAEDEEAA